MADEQDVLRRVKENLEGQTEDLLNKHPEDREAILRIAYHHDLNAILKTLKQINDNLTQMNRSLTGINRNTK